MAGRLNLSVSELTIRDNRGRVSKRYRMLNHNDVISCLLTIAESSNERTTKDNVAKVIGMIADLNPNV